MLLGGTFNASFANVRGRFKLVRFRCRGQRSYSSAYLEAVEVGHDLWIEKSDFDSDVYLENAKVGNYLSILFCSFEGGLDIRNAQVAKRVELQSIRPRSEMGELIVDAGGLVTSPQGELVLKSEKDAGAMGPRRGSFRLDHAKVGVLTDGPNFWSAFEVVKLGTFSYEKISEESENAWGNIENRLSWMQEKCSSFSFEPEPYESLARTMINLGKNELAKKVLYAREEALSIFLRRTSRGTFFGWLNQLWRLVLKLVTGYGQRPRNLFTSLCIIYGLSVCTVGVAKYENAMVPTNITSLQASSDSTLRSRDCSTAYPCVNVPLFAMQAALPELDLHQSAFWEIGGASMTAELLETAFGLLTILGWLVSLLAVATATGFIDRRSRS